MKTMIVQTHRQARRQRDGQAHTRGRRSVCVGDILRWAVVCVGCAGACWALLGRCHHVTTCLCCTPYNSLQWDPSSPGRGGAVRHMHLCPQALLLTVHLGVGAAADDCSRLPQVCLQGTWGHHAAVGGHLATAGSGAAKQPATLKRRTHARLSDGRAMPSHAVIARALEAGTLSALPGAVPGSPVPDVLRHQLRHASLADPTTSSCLPSCVCWAASRTVCLRPSTPRGGLPCGSRLPEG